VLNREFSVSEPDRVWVGDITYIATDEGWLFLAVVIDLFSRQVVGWSLRDDMTRDIVIDALRMAWFKRHPGKQAGLTFHSDRGSQYASSRLQGPCSRKYGITSSMSRKGNCWDNACSETLFGSLKVERLHGQRFKTRREAKDEAIDWLLWYKPRSTALDAGLRQPDAVRAGMACQSANGKPTHELGYGVRIPGARSVIEPHYPLAGRGRWPLSIAGHAASALDEELVPAERPALKKALNGVASLRTFAELGQEAIPTRLFSRTSGICWRPTIWPRTSLMGSTSRTPLAFSARKLVACSVPP
jgi:hypothetical protein